MSNRITDQAGLIVTFYGPRKQMQNRTNLLGAALGLVPQAFPERPDVSAPEREEFLRYFDPPAAHDTRVIQLALNEAGEASVAWERLRERVEGLDLAGVWEVIWGYTLIYHAVLVDVGHEIPGAWLKPARRLASSALSASSASQRAQPLARSKVLEGHLWLLDVPSKEQEEGMQAASVYMALYPPHQEDEFITHVLYGPNATLLMPDLIAHKGYRQTRQYIGTPRELYRQQIQKSQQIISSLLDFSPNTTRLIQASSNINPSTSSGHRQNLALLSSAYTKLLDVTHRLDDVRLSLAQQVENYGWWEEQLTPSPLTSFHDKQMRTAHRDLDLLIGKGQSTLEAVRTAIEMIQTHLQQARDEREQWFQVILAGAAVAFAVSALIDAQAADALITLFMPFLADNPFRQLLLKLTISLLLTLVIAFGYHTRRKKSPPS